QGRTRFVQAGDRVQRGTVLASVRQEDYRQSAAEARGAMEAARAAAVKARLDYDRASNLLASKVIPQADYDAAKARTDGASAAVDTAEARRAATRARGAGAPGLRGRGGARRPDRAPAAGDRGPVDRERGGDRERPAPRRASRGAGRDAAERRPDSPARSVAPRGPPWRTRP